MAGEDFGPQMTTRGSAFQSSSPSGAICAIEASSPRVLANRASVSLARKSSYAMTGRPAPSVRKGTMIVRHGAPKKPSAARRVRCRCVHVSLERAAGGAGPSVAEPCSGSVGSGTSAVAAARSLRSSWRTRLVLPSRSRSAIISGYSASRLPPASSASSQRATNCSDGVTLALSTCARCGRLKLIAFAKLS